MSRHLIILSQNNSGSTWLSRCISREYNCYPKEYFNSILNYAVQSDLKGILGNELEYRALAKTADPYIFDHAIRNTWKAQSEYTATKENFMVFNVANAIRHFDDVVVLLRSAELCFPPERVRVKVWYNKWWDSLRENEKICPGISAHSITNKYTHQQRAIIAWQICNWKLETDADKYKIPILRYSDLMDADESELTKMCGGLFDVQKIIETRVPATVNHVYLHEWEHAFKTLSDIQEYKSEQKKWMR